MESSGLPQADSSSSQHTSMSQIEKVKTLSRASSRHNSQHEQEEKVKGATPLSGGEALDRLSVEPEYPSGVKLGIIMASLGLSVFLMALVSPKPRGLTITLTMYYIKLPFS